MNTGDPILVCRVVIAKLNIKVPKVKFANGIVSPSCMLLIPIQKPGKVKAIFFCLCFPLNSANT